MVSLTASLRRKIHLKRQVQEQEQEAKLQLERT